jgi:hypothetical protein
MQKYKIKFNGVNDKTDYLALANKQSYDIDLTYGRYRIDGKSALGVLSMLPDNNTQITAEFYSDSADIKNVFKRWIYD